MTAGPVALAWSGGKDSALALDALRRDGTEVAALLTTFTDDYDRVSMHGVRRALVREQAAAAGLPLVEVRIPAGCGDEVYAARMEAAFRAPPLAELDAVAFGDLFLDDVRAYREERLASAGKAALFPLWGRDTAALARSFVAAGFEAYVVCVDTRTLDASFAGRDYDAAFLDELPPEIDPCGENGEFHSFVHAGPCFDRPVRCRVGERVLREGFAFADLVANARADTCGARSPAGSRAAR
jgi:uncharacterized protein (TIGR00290 family)